MALFQADYIILRLLKFSPFERHGDRWRFGTKSISESVAARLIASGRAEVVGDRLRLAVPVSLRELTPVITVDATMHYRDDVEVIIETLTALKPLVPAETMDAQIYAGSGSLRAGDPV